MLWSLSYVMMLFLTLFFQNISFILSLLFFRLILYLKFISQLFTNTSKQIKNIYTLDEIITTNNIKKIDLMKIDVENSCVSVLESLSPNNAMKVKNLLIEIEDYFNEGHYDTVMEILSHKHQFARIWKIDEYTLLAQR